MDRKGLEAFRSDLDDGQFRDRKVDRVSVLSGHLALDLSMHSKDDSIFTGSSTTTTGIIRR